MPYDMTSKLAGDEISSTYEGRHVECLESTLVHVNPGDGLVDKGQAVVMGKLVGIALRDALAATDIIAVETEGIWALSVVAVDQNGNSAVARGDRIYINFTTAVLSKINTPATNIPFGIALSTLATGTTGIVAVKIHQDPDTMGEISVLTSEELDHSAFTNETGTALGHIDITAGQLPARSLVLGTSINVTEGFAGDTTAIVQVGGTVDLDRFSSVTDQSVLAIGRVAMGIPVDGQDGFAAAQTVRVTVTGGADWDNITAGKMFVSIYYIALA
jgi:predicted RecA/RadA family phage recombinase